MRLKARCWRPPKNDPEKVVPKMRENKATLSESIDNMKCGARYMKAILLTRSGKCGGACVAGIDLASNRFVRFVREAASASEIPFSEIRGLMPLDILEVEILSRCPIGPQSENILVPRFAFRKTGFFSGSIPALAACIRYPDRGSLLADTENRLRSPGELRHSLELVTVQNLCFRKVLKYDRTETTRAAFDYHGRHYTDFRVTDLRFDLRKGNEEECFVPHAGLVLSIPKDPYTVAQNNFGYYKFVASVFPLEACPVPKPTMPVSEGRQRLRDLVPGTREQSYEPWTAQEDEALIEAYRAQMSVRQIAEQHQRSDGAIRSRLKKLDLIP